MGILNSTLRLQWSSLLWFALPLSPLPSQRPSPRPRLTPGTPMDMLATPTLTEPTEAITAKADPWYTYGAYAGYPYAYSGLYHGYAGYPYAYYGKRSADAEPEADADAFYGYYGYARPYAYGYRYGGY